MVKLILEKIYNAMITEVPKEMVYMVYGIYLIVMFVLIDMSITLKDLGISIS